MSGIAEVSAKTNAWPYGIFAITLFVEDLEETKEFYQRVFGLPAIYEDSTSAVFKFGGTLINLLKITEANDNAAWHFGAVSAFHSCETQQAKSRLLFLRV